MKKINITMVHLLGFPGLGGFRFLLFFFLLISYCLILLGNMLIIFLVAISRNLQSPMYIFLTQLSLLDILLTTDILPNMLNITFHEGSSMSLGSCFFQFCFFTFLECSECLLLTVMSYDRYLAICKPLHYNSRINKEFCLKSIVSSCILGYFAPFVNTESVRNLDFCGPNIIDHFFCDYEPLLRLSCSNTFGIRIQTMTVGFFILACPFLIIVTSYVWIIRAILKIQSVCGREKAFLTCSSHLTVVAIYYGTLTSVYMVPTEGQLVILGKLLSLLYIVVAPLLNPAIYTIRNKDFMKAFEKLKTFSGMKLFHG